MPDQINIYNLRMLPWGFWFIEYYTGGAKCFGHGRKEGLRVEHLMNVEHWADVNKDYGEDNVE